MTMTDPSQPPPEEAERMLGEQLERLMLAQLIAAQNPDEPQTAADVKVLEKIATTAAKLAVYAAIARLMKAGVRPQEAVEQKDVDRWIRQTTDKLVTDSRDMAIHAAERMAPTPGDLSPTIDVKAQQNDSWARNVSDSLSTRLVAESVISMAKPIEDHYGVEMKKVWISRGDNRVRESHRTLHGKTADLDKPFWRELGTSKTLSYPGDPAAPLDQTVNCRCFLFLVKKPEASKAEEVLHIPAHEFALAAAGVESHFNPNQPRGGDGRWIEIGDWMEFVKGGKGKRMKVVRLTSWGNVVVDLNGEEKEILPSYIRQAPEKARLDEPAPVVKPRRGPLTGESATSHLADWSPDFTQEEKDAVENYTAAAGDFNMWLRDGRPEPNDEFETQASTMDGMMRPLDVAIRVHRFVSHDVLAGADPDSLVGQTVVDDGFVSTSADLKSFRVSEIAPQDFGETHLEITVPSGYLALYAWENSVYPEQEEVILPRGTGLRIISVKRSPNGKLLIKGEVVPPAKNLESARGR